LWKKKTLWKRRCI